MFKWICLVTAIIFLGAVGWMINDVRQEIRRSIQEVHETGLTINEQLPPVVDKIRNSADVISESLPEVVERIKKSTETLAELAEDIRQLKELVGVSNTARDKSLVAYADSVLDTIDASKGSIGLKKTFGGSGLKNVLPAREWVVGARKEALFLTVVAKSKQELLTRLVENKFGSHWYIQLENQNPVDLIDWLKANHVATGEL
ncbi:MAG: hypothetical protein JWM11_7768 [Planctomycetaceae bacterium]|nr:hypothetical protein [Planctomycetaceae bacterium]